jgi:DNA-binding transcriptional MerR regulator
VPTEDEDVMTNYSVNELANLSGVTPRTLRYYDKVGLLVPMRKGTGDYRVYTEEDVDKLQEIMLYKNMGMSLSEIHNLIGSGSKNRAGRLSVHLNKLFKQKADLDILIKNVQDTISSEKGGKKMSDTKKFQGLKKEIIEDNEEKYGKEIRKAYGDDAIDGANMKMMGLSQEEFDEMGRIGNEIISRLESAVTSKLSTDSDEALEIAEIHKKWLSYTWSKYSSEAHAGLAHVYVSDGRFKAYYDKNVNGCAEFLSEAILNMTKIH